LQLILELVRNKEEKGGGTPDFIQDVSALVFLFIRNRLTWLGVKSTEEFLLFCSFLILTCFFFNAAEV